LIRERAEFADAALDLFVGGGEGDADVVTGKDAEAGAWCYRDIARSQQVECKLPAWTLHVDQDVECAVGGIEVAVVLFEQGYREVAAVTIGFTHLDNARLRAGESR